jgi:hypothetical protein
MIDGNIVFSFLILRGYGVEPLFLTVLDLRYHDAKKVENKDVTPFLFHPHFFSLRLNFRTYEDMTPLPH